MSDRFSASHGFAVAKKIIIVGYVYASRQNGCVCSPKGLAPCVSVGCHAGVEPRIIVITEK